MGAQRFDVIIVGGGLAGSAAALELSRQGRSVLVLERGRSCGSKNVSGGRLYGHSLERLVPGFADEAPVERRVTKERVTLMTDENATTLEYSSASPKEDSSSYTVLRARFDPWLARKAQDAGALYVLGTRVDGIVRDKSKGTGVVCDDEEVWGDVVILADGVNSLVAQRAGLRGELDPSQVGLGVKEVIKLDERLVCDRFGVEPGEGVAWVFVGSITGGAQGGAFLYTNKASISLGAVVSLAELGHGGLPASGLIERFKDHPLVRPLLEKGSLAEYSAHLVPEGGFGMVPALCGDGVMLAGDAAGFVINLGYQIRGMDLALESGRLAAKAASQAIAQGDCSAAGLAPYRSMLEKSFVLGDLSHHRRAPAFMENPYLFETLPDLADDVMEDLFTVDGKPKGRITARMRHIISRHGGLVPLAKVFLKARKAL